MMMKAFIFRLIFALIELDFTGLSYTCTIIRITDIPTFVSFFISETKIIKHEKVFYEKRNMLRRLHFSEPFTVERDRSFMPGFRLFGIVGTDCEL